MSGHRYFYHDGRYGIAPETPLGGGRAIRWDKPAKRVTDRDAAKLVRDFIECFEAGEVAKKYKLTKAAVTKLAKAGDILSAVWEPHRGDDESVPLIVLDADTRNKLRAARAARKRKD